MTLSPRVARGVAVAGSRRARIALERHAWDEAAAVSAAWPSDVPWDQYPHLLAIPFFAQAMGAARTGDFEAAEAAIAKLTELEQGARNLRAT